MSGESDMVKRMYEEDVRGLCWVDKVGLSLYFGGVDDERAGYC